jgi:hypothetical protein
MIVVAVDDLLFSSKIRATARQAMKKDPALASIRTLGFVSHVHTALINAARAAGADEVMARSAFAGQLADILLTDRIVKPDHAR